MLWGLGFTLKTLLGSHSFKQSHLVPPAEPQKLEFDLLEEVGHLDVVSPVHSGLGPHGTECRVDIFPWIEVKG